MGRKSKDEERAEEERIFKSARYARATILGLIPRAERGDKQAVEYLRGWLTRYPKMRSLVRALDDLSTRVERAWVDRMCGPDELSREAITAEVAALKAELLGRQPSVAEKVLVGTVVVAFF
ncbi:MAG TPA: hypothetical protein VH092_10245 [Urbifossiella sp.]|nr:hypothetical protein [Urbifossiella sp.]